MLLSLLLVVMRLLRWFGTMVAPSHRRLLSTSNSGFEIINASCKVDEERIPHYRPSFFYPVYLRDIFESRYQVLSKLGYGSRSTVWLSRDIMFVMILRIITELTKLYSKQKYVVLKVCISDYPCIDRERAAHAHLREVLRTYKGSFQSHLLRTPLAEFELSRDDKKHWCFVFEPLTIDLVTTRATFRFDEVVFKNVAFHVFRALEFLHTNAQMVHCGASPFSWLL